ncbi:hypothetical protein DVH24_002998 [Malus domestica]|uniref:Uncharacterized protein n=1 Tax=Malus domestica TaxID=3750 RepID=A0A498K3Y9_MALDO|nr:hypothetical protein DVH24_002998 [Malus domestica]
MALIVRRFIVMPKTNIVQIPICESYRHRPGNICEDSRRDISKGPGGKINETTTLKKQNVSDEISSSKSNQNDGKQSNGDAKATTKETASTG